MKEHRKRQSDEDNEDDDSSSSSSLELHRFMVAKPPGGDTPFPGARDMTELWWHGTEVLSGKLGLGYPVLSYFEFWVGEQEAQVSRHWWISPVCQRGVLSSLHFPLSHSCISYWKPLKAFFLFS